MPCSGNDGSYAPGDVANSRVDALQRRVADLEAALCGLLKTMGRASSEADKVEAMMTVGRWWDEHCSSHGHRK